MSSVQLTPMRPEHVPAAHAVEVASQITPWSQEFLGAELNDPSRHYLVALRGHQVVAFGGVMVAVDEAHITNVAVDPNSRRQGVGRLLVSGLLALAGAHGATAATLEVRAGNTAARRLYSRLGFVPAGIRPRYYQPAEDAIIMWLHDLDVRQGAA